MGDNIQVKNIDGYDVIMFQPQGVCCRLMQVRIKDDIIHDVEFVGGCSGNLSGVGLLVKGMSIKDIIPKLSGVHCGSKATSCPDQFTKCLEAYVKYKSAAKV